MAVTRREILQVVGAGLATAVIGTGTGAAQEGSTDGWSQVARDARNSSYNPDVTGPRFEPESAWQYEPDTDGGIRAPVARGGTVYAAPGNQVVAVDAETGEEQWTVDAAGATSVATDGERVYFGTATGMQAVDAATGEEEWVFEASAEGLSGPGSRPPDDADIEIGIQFPPTVHSSVVYGSSTFGLYAVDAESGEQEWGLASQTAETPAVSENVIVTPSINFESNVLLHRDFVPDQWPDDLNGGGGQSDTGPGKLFMAEVGEWLAFRFPANWQIVSRMSIGESVFMPGRGVSRFNPVDEISAFEEFKQKGLQRQESEPAFGEWYPGENMAIAASPAITESSFLFGSGTRVEGVQNEWEEKAGTVFSYDKESGETTWAQDVDGSVNTSPAVTEDRVFVATDAGTVFGLDREEGWEHWQFDIGDSANAPVPDGQWLYVGTDSRLVALREPVEENDGSTDDGSTDDGSTDDSSETDSNSDGSETDGGSSTDDTGSNETDSTESPDGSGPGFGVGGAVAGVGAAAYLRSRLKSDESE